MADKDSSPTPSHNLEAAYEKLQQRITQACERSCRDPEDILLLPASKTRTADDIREVMDLGLTAVGENRIQEVKAKIGFLPNSLQWHFIGGLQRNKVRDAVMYCSWIHSIDSEALAQEIEKRAASHGRRPKVLIEVNVAGEASKHGVAPTEVPALAEAVNKCSHLELYGLMTVAPFYEDLEKVRPYFVKMRELREHLEQELGYHLPELSMGMSHDFELAIEEGATIVRVGTALFGPRKAVKKG